MKKKVRVISGNILFLNNIYWRSLKDDGGADRSNRRPPQCHCGALPTELRPRNLCDKESYAIRRDQMGFMLLSWEEVVFLKGRAS